MSKVGAAGARLIRGPDDLANICVGPGSVGSFEAFILVHFVDKFDRWLDAETDPGHIL